MPKPVHFFQKVLLLISIFLFSMKVSAQTEQMFTSDDNLSSTLIKKIFYDSRGMIWIVTEYGLNRFDGSKFKVYHNIPSDSTSVASNFINNIFEDKDHRLFICSHSGLQIYNPATDRFSTPMRHDVTGRAGTGMSDVVQNSKGELWAVGNAIYRINGFGEQPRLSDAGFDMVHSASRAVCDADNNLWMSREQTGIYRISPDGSIKHYFGKEGDPSIITMTVVDGCDLYVGTETRGMLKYSKITDSFEPVDLGESRLCIRVIYPDNYGNLLVGTDGSGLKVYNPKDGSVFNYHFPSLDSNRLKIHALTIDDYGNTWVGIYQKGVVKIPPVSKFFRSIGQNSVGYNVIGSCCVTAITRLDSGQLMVGTDNDGVYSVDLTTAQSRHFTSNLPKSIVHMFEDSYKRLWIGSYDKGCGILDPTNGTYTPVNLNDNGKQVRHIYDFEELPDGKILMGTMGNGLIEYDPDSHTSRKIEIDGLNDWVTTLAISKRDGSIYVGTYDGFYVVDPQFKNSRRMDWRMIVYAIHEEPEHGHIWLGTSEGLVKVDKDMNTERIYTTADGLPSMAVYAIEHGDDALWLSSNRGLTKFAPGQESFINFSVDNGLPQNEFHKNTSFKDKSGNIYFGGISGIAYFKASDINIDSPKLTLRVTDFFIGDRSIVAGDKSGSRTIIDVPLADAEIFRLSHCDNSFSVRFSTKEFLNPSQSEFYYALDDNEWTRMPSTDNTYGASTLIFSDMASGHHNLKVKAVNGGVESDPLSLMIDIDHVWYATWWAMVVYMLTVVLLVFLMYRHFQERARIVHEEEERRNQARILESKLQFFTNISHEIRTPLSLVISPLQKLIDSDKDKERTTMYNTIMRNANRILRLVNEMMDLRKIDNKQMKLRFTEVNLCEFVSDLYETFLPAAKLRKVNLTYTHTDCDDLKAWVDKSNFDKIVMNLVSNAVKFTPDGGSVAINLTKGEERTVDGPLRKYAEISITDTGIGISEKDRKHIFNRFFQASNNNAGGTGIGLHLTSQLVDLHHGTISISDNPEGQGTRFTVRIPLGNEHLRADELMTTETAHTPKITEVNYTADLVACEEEGNTTRQTPRKRDLVYIVEDDEEIRRYLVDSFSKHYKTEGFSNGRLALESMHTQCPSLVITDVMMPEMDGITLTRKIKQNINLNHVPVIVLTAKTQEEDHIEVMESGANAYIKKPFSIDVLLKTAQNKIESVQMMRNALSGNQAHADKLDDIKVTSGDEKLMERVMKVINKNLSNADITVEMIAQEIGISRVHLHRKLKELTNQSTRDFIRNIRLQAAAKLLSEKKLTVAEVSDLVGFKQPNNFSTCFKEMYGMSPSAYAQKFHPKPE